MKILVVGGTWDLEGGRPSKLAEQFYKGVCEGSPGGAELLNGGDFRNISWTPECHSGVWGSPDDPYEDAPDVLFWMPNVPNDARKIIGEIKQHYPRMLLIGSKRIDDRDIGLPEVIDRMLASKQNLGVILDKVNGRFRAKLIDPLGNLFYHGADFQELGKAAADRVRFLASVRRVRSKHCGALSGKAVEVPKPFLSLIRQCADEFDRLVPRPKKVSRFLGNAAFRCSHGFPAFRGGNGIIYVSRRNVDKSGIGQDGFVAVKPFEPFDGQVEFYHRDHLVKPSVDTPIDLLIFHHCPKIHYLIHGHVYLDTNNFTDKPIPCGAVEEFGALRGKLPPTITAFGINLKGHGFIAGASSVASLQTLCDNTPFKARPAEETA